LIKITRSDLTLALERSGMITLASDFGSPYPASMKGVILDACDVRIVDISHNFPRQDVRTAAFWLREVLPYYPPAVHCAVIDPGVGTDRAALVLRAGEHLLVGPDNGLLLPAARSLGDSIDIFEWEYDTPDSATFHGRDVFAPAAATVHEIGSEAIENIESVMQTEEYVDISFPDPEQSETEATGEVLVIDGFGNVITNIPSSILDGLFGESIVVNDSDCVPVERFYAAYEAGTRLVTVGSHGNVELAVNRGRGGEAFGVDVGDEVRLEW
jgi:S-adenosylmethionine hydrolase